jgi:DNA-binding transcriptional regulator YiaG
VTLHEWFVAEQARGVTGSVERVAALLGEPVALVRSWASGRVLPTLMQRQLIGQVTKGAVGPGDWR